MMDNFHEMHRQRATGIINNSTCPKCGKKGEVFLCEECTREGKERSAQILDDKKNGIYHLKRIVAKNIHRARMVGNKATLTIEEWRNILELHNWTCFYCKVKPYVVLEHKTPICKGGGTTADNCVPACVECNVSKSNH